MLLAIGAANTGSLSLASFLCNENFLIFLQVSRPAGPADGNYEEAWGTPGREEGSFGGREWGGRVKRSPALHFKSSTC